MAIQRYLATRDAKAARRAFLVTGLANIIITLCLASLGFFQTHPELLAQGMTIDQDGDKLFPFFIVRFLRPGITGLVIAGLLAAAMSSLSSGINSASSVVSVDFVDRFRPPDRVDSDAAQMRRARLIAVVSGLAAVLLSTVMGGVTGNIMEVTVRTNHIFVAPLFGLFFMALFVPFATTVGTIVGAVAGCAVAVVIAYWDLITGGATLSFQWISLISLTVNMAVAIPLSAATYKPRTSS